jgi:iron complex outermembrane receptor protein
MNRFLPILFSLFLLIHINGFAQQSGSIRGLVTTADGKPAAGVNVSLQGKGNGTTTNERGRYHLRRVTPGSYTLRVSYMGLKTEEQAVTVNAGQELTIDVMLSENNQELQEVQVSSGKNKYKADKPSSTLRLNEPLLETPQNIQVITSQTLADQQVISMNDGVLRNVAGATKIEHWGNLYTRVNMRGSRASAFRNGMNVTSNWGPLNEDMSFVERIEFVKGPAGFMMSNGEPSGIYNVVTKKPTGRDFNGEANITLGSYDLYRTTLDLDGKMTKSGNLLYRFNLMGQTQNSFRPFEFNNRMAIAPVITYKIDDKTTLTAEYTYQFNKMSNVGSFYAFGPMSGGFASLPRNFTLAQPGVDPTRIKDHSAFVYVHHQIDNNWKLTGQLGYFNYSQVGSSAWLNPISGSLNVAPNGDVQRYVSIWDAANESKFGQLFVNGDVQTGSVHHRILAGLDLGTKRYIADFGQSFNLDGPGKYFNIYRPNYGTPLNGLPVFNRSQPLEQRGAGNLVDQSYTGLYGQDELGFLNNKLRLTLAGRYTYVQQSSYITTRTRNRQFTPRIGLSGNIDDNTTAYALFDQSFVPQAGQLRNGEQPKPITGNNLEFGLKRDWFNQRWNTTLSVYRILKNNATAADPTNQAGEPYLINIGQTKTQGIEFDARGEIVSGLNLITNYAFTDQKITEASSLLPATLGNRVPGFAKHNANAWLTYTVQHGGLKGAGISGGFTFQGKRSTWSWTGAIATTQLPDYYKFDGGIFWGLNKVRFTANVFNIFNKYLYSGAAYANYLYWQAEAGTNYRVGMTYRF